MKLEERIREQVREIPDFPKQGIVFKDITPILLDQVLCREIVQAYCQTYREREIDALVGIESRGFFFGSLIAYELGVPFVPARKKGKLPARTLSKRYELEYGTAEMEVHADAIQPGWRVLVHDDLLATGGTAAATVELVRMASASVVACSFLIELAFLNGRKKIIETGVTDIESLVIYD